MAKVVQARGQPRPRGAAAPGSGQAVPLRAASARLPAVFLPPRGACCASQHPALLCIALPGAAVHGGALHRPAPFCSALLCLALSCSALHRDSGEPRDRVGVLQAVAEGSVMGRGARLALPLLSQPKPNAERGLLSLC